jgi:hypothetical protein
VFSTAIIIVILTGYWWWGSARSDDTEFMRAQVLRRLGHTAIAERIELRLSPTLEPVAE